MKKEGKHKIGIRIPVAKPNSVHKSKKGQGSYVRKKKHKEQL
jgi:hypothetical protein